VLERILDAPMELAWQLWTDPEHFKAWHGPDGASILERREFAPVAEQCRHQLWVDRQG
jgi:uncharacterized protein YndB with AHSA1/START domain